MKDFKLGGYYVLLDRTAFFTREYVMAGNVKSIPTGAVVKVVYIDVFTTNVLLSDGRVLFTFESDRSKFRPASNKQIAQYRKEQVVSPCTR